MIEYPHRHLYYKFEKGNCVHLSERLCLDWHDPNVITDHCVCDDCWKYHVEWWEALEETQEQRYKAELYEN